MAILRIGLQMVSENNAPPKNRKCAVCNSFENEPRIIGNYTVHLSLISVNGREQLVCQGCNRKLKTQETYKKKNSLKNRLSFLGFRRK